MGAKCCVPRRQSGGGGNENRAEQYRDVERVGKLECLHGSNAFVLKAVLALFSQLSDYILKRMFDTKFIMQTPIETQSRVKPAVNVIEATTSSKHELNVSENNISGLERGMDTVPSFVGKFKVGEALVALC